MRVIIFVNCDSLAFGEGREIAPTYAGEEVPRRPPT
jgi:hypothetical protein